MLPDPQGTRATTTSTLPCPGFWIDVLNELDLAFDFSDSHQSAIGAFPCLTFCSSGFLEIVSVRKFCTRMPGRLRLMVLRDVFNVDHVWSEAT